MSFYNRLHDKHLMGSVFNPVTPGLGATNPGITGSENSAGNKFGIPGLLTLSVTRTPEMFGAH